MVPVQVARRSVVPVLLVVCYRWRGVPWYQYRWLGFPWYQCCWLCATGGEAFCGTSAVGCVLQVARRSVVPVLLVVCVTVRLERVTVFI